MSIKVFSAATVGLSGYEVEVEVDVLSAGLHKMTIVGLPDTGVKESRDRVSSAIKNSGFKPVHRFGRITVNLAPANLPKLSPIYDVAIALGFLLTTEQAEFETHSSFFIGELALDGRVRPVHGILPIALFAKEHGIQNLYVPTENAPEAAVVDGVTVYPVQNLQELIYHLEGTVPLRHFVSDIKKEMFTHSTSPVDMSHIAGQYNAKRALEIAAAGGHNVLFNGPPGSGKTLLAKALPGILPRLTLEESLEITKIYSVAGVLPKNTALYTERPYRSPHHSSSAVSLIGGGTIPRPGEISLSHRGVLFLDEFGEFPKSVLENLRQPLEDGVVTISRARGTHTFPARFLLVAAMNPCPCGNATDPDKECTCSLPVIDRYKQRISGPILDRIDMHIEVARLEYEKLRQEENSETSDSIRNRVEAARSRQRERFSSNDTHGNAEMTAQEVHEHCALQDESEKILKYAITKHALSARAYTRILKVARTIADLEGSEAILSTHIAESIRYRLRTRE